MAEATGKLSGVSSVENRFFLCSSILAMDEEELNYVFIGQLVSSGDVNDEDLTVERMCHSELS